MNPTKHAQKGVGGHSSVKKREASHRPIENIDRTNVHPRSLTLNASLVVGDSTSSARLTCFSSIGGPGTGTIAPPAPPPPPPLPAPPPGWCIMAGWCMCPLTGVCPRRDTEHRDKSTRQGWVS